MKKLANLIAAVSLVGIWLAVSTAISRGEDPPKLLSEATIRQLTADGDRLADQGDYLAALQRYTTAYMGVVSSIRGQSFTQSVVPNIYNREETHPSGPVLPKYIPPPSSSAFPCPAWSHLSSTDPLW